MKYFHGHRSKEKEEEREKDFIKMQRTLLTKILK